MILTTATPVGYIQIKSCGKGGTYDWWTRNCCQDLDCVAGCSEVCLQNNQGRWEISVKTLYCCWCFRKSPFCRPWNRIHEDANWNLKSILWGEEFHICHIYFLCWDDTEPIFRVPRGFLETNIVMLDPLWAFSPLSCLATVNVVNSSVLQQEGEGAKVYFSYRRSVRGVRTTFSFWPKSSMTSQGETSQIWFSASVAEREEPCQVPFSLARRGPWTAASLWSIQGLVMEFSQRWSVFFWTTGFYINNDTRYNPLIFSIVLIASWENTFSAPLFIC